MVSTRIDSEWEMWFPPVDSTHFHHDLIHLKFHRSSSSVFFPLRPSPIAHSRAQRTRSARKVGVKLSLQLFLPPSANNRAAASCMDSSDWPESPVPRSDWQPGGVRPFCVRVAPLHLKGALRAWKRGQHFWTEAQRCSTVSEEPRGEELCGRDGWPSVN